MEISYLATICNRKRGYASDPEKTGKVNTIQIKHIFLAQAFFWNKFTMI
jgi:hypothetical protein